MKPDEKQILKLQPVLTPIVHSKRDHDYLLAHLMEKRTSTVQIQRGFYD